MKLTNVAGRKGLAALVTVVSLAMASQAWAQPDCTQVRVRGTARQDAISPLADLALRDIGSASVPQLATIIQDCEGTLSRTARNSIPALMCVSRAQIEIATRDNQPSLQYFAQARCNLYRAGELTRRDVAARSRANGLRAEALLGLRSVDPGHAASYESELQRMHDSAGNEASPRVHSAIAELFVRRNDDRGAISEVNSHLQSRARALALIKIADLQRNMQRPSSVVLGTLRDAQSADSQSVAVNSQLGRSYYEMGSSSDARTYLELAISRSPEPEEQAYLPDAFYYLSLIVEQGDPARAATLARDAGPSQFRYQRQACLMQLKLGGARVFDRYREGNNWIARPVDSLPGYTACQLGDSPEARLLRGMFWLRRSQFYMPPPVLGTPAMRRYQEQVAEASRAFARVDDSTPLGWPGRTPTNGQHPTMREMIDYGRELTAYFDGICLGASRPSDGGSGAAAVYAYYGLSDCEPRM